MSLPPTLLSKLVNKKAPTLLNKLYQIIDNPNAIIVLVSKFDLYKLVDIFMLDASRSLIIRNYYIEVLMVHYLSLINNFKFLAQFDNLMFAQSHFLFPWAITS
jgi:hypothetical protein